MKKNAIMLADTRPALIGIILLQLQKTNPHLYNEAIIYYTEQISCSDRALMSSIMPCRFVQYKPPMPHDLFEKPRFRRFSILMFCRYEMFAYLNEFETITWLDTDILIQGDLSEMIDLARNTGAAFIREDPFNKTSEKVDYMRTCFTQDVSGFQMDAYLYCSGTIVLTNQILTEQQINGEQCTKWCYQKTVEWANILDLPDQGVLNAAIQHFSIKVSLLNGEKYCCYPALGRNCKDAAIIHAWGSNKFWNDWYLYVNYSNWGEYYNDWKRLGGCTLGYEIKPSVSIIIPSYKPNLTFLKQCLDSLMNQCRDGWERYSDFEIIIISEPIEQEKIKALVNLYCDNRICLKVNPKRLGIAASLNWGIKHAKGQYIARMDDDDLCDKARIFLQVNYLKDHKDITLCTSDFAYFGDMNENRIIFEGDMSYAWSIFTCPFDHPTIMFKKQFFIQNQLYYDETRDYVEDWELWRRAFKKGMKVGCIHRVLFYHRWINNASAGQTTKTVDMMREMIRKNFEELGVEILPEHLWMIGPWNGKVQNATDIKQLQKYFDEALKNNKNYKIYDQICLKKAFQFRIEEANTGMLPKLSEKNNMSRTANHEEPKGIMRSYLKKLLKKLLKPIYRPFRVRYENRLIDIMETLGRQERELEHMMLAITHMQNKLEQQNENRLIDIMETLGRQERELEHMMLAITHMQNKLEQQIESLQHTLWKTGEILKNTIKDSLESQTWNLLYELTNRDFMGHQDSSIYDFTFYLDNRYHSVLSAQHVLPKLFSFLPHRKVADFGCGTGTWLWVANQIGTEEVTGFDGHYVPKNLLMIPESRFFPVDLEKKIDIRERFDLAFCMEVAEHLKEESSNLLVQTLCGSSDILLFSAAHPGQGGDGHINEQPLEYWIDKFESCGFEQIEIRQLFKDNNRIDWWYRDNITLFVKKGCKCNEIRQSVKQFKAE